MRIANITCPSGVRQPSSIDCQSLRFGQAQVGRRTARCKQLTCVASRSPDRPSVIRSAPSPAQHDQPPTQLVDRRNLALGEAQARCRAHRLSNTALGQHKLRSTCCAGLLTALRPFRADHGIHAGASSRARDTSPYLELCLSVSTRSRAYVPAQAPRLRLRCPRAHAWLVRRGRQRPHQRSLYRRRRGPDRGQRRGRSASSRGPWQRAWAATRQPSSSTRGAYLALVLQQLQAAATHATLQKNCSRLADRRR